LKQTLAYNANLGISPDKLLLGFSFYGTGWPASFATIPSTTRTIGTDPATYPLVKDD